MTHVHTLLARAAVVLAVALAVACAVLGFERAARRAGRDAERRETERRADAARERMLRVAPPDDRALRGRLRDGTF